MKSLLLLAFLVSTVFYYPVIHAQNSVVVIPMFEEGRTLWKGPWQENVDYNESDTVEFGGSSYIALQTHTSNLSNIPPEQDLWDLVAASGANGIQGSTGQNGEQGPAGPQGMIGQTGVQGATGETGATGSQGETGDAGDSVFSRSGNDIQSNNSGKVGIGIAPTQKLTINGSLKIGSEFGPVESGVIQHTSSGFEGFHAGRWRKLQKTIQTIIATRHSFSAGQSSEHFVHGTSFSFMKPGVTSTTIYIPLPMPSGARLHHVRLVAKDISQTHRIRMRVFEDSTGLGQPPIISAIGDAVYSSGTDNDQFEIMVMTNPSTSIPSGLFDGFYVSLMCVLEDDTVPVQWIGDELQFSKITYSFEPN